MIVARAQKQNTLYVMHARLCRNDINVAADTTGELWHKRLGHMSQRGMQMLAKKELLSEVENVHLETYIDYLADKQNRVSFRPRPLMRRMNALECMLYGCKITCQ